MNRTQDNRSSLELLQDLAKATTERPEGIVDWMHYGFRLRNACMWEREDANPELERLEAHALHLPENVLTQLASLFEERAWTAGRVGTLNLADLLWTRISPTAQGNFLAGVMQQLDDQGPFSASATSGGSEKAAKSENDLATWVLQRLPMATLEAPAAAEFGASAIFSKNFALLQALLNKGELPEGPIPRFRGYREQLHFEKQLSLLSTRVLDVLLEAALRCMRPEAVQILLEHGANPDIPCWILERSYNEWHCALSYAIQQSREESNPKAKQIVGLLLTHGADPQGLECAGKNLPLMLAIRHRDWRLADLLLDLGAKFEGGQDYTEERCQKKGKLIPAGHALIGYRDEELRWVERAIAPLVPLAKVWEVPLYYRGDGQGGSVSTFLNHLVSDVDLPYLSKYESRGLAATLTPTLLIDLVKGGCYEALQYLLRDNPNLGRVMFRIRRHKPDFGTEGEQVMRCVPEKDGSNLLHGYMPCEETALNLPDGSRVHPWLDCIAPPVHHHGPISPGCFWLQTLSADFRRRGDQLKTQCIRRIWRAVDTPKNDYQLEDLIPMVKEANGTFILLGISLRALRYGQKFPDAWKEHIDHWRNGVATHLVREQFVERMTSQMSMNVDAPRPVLIEKDLKAYPPEFWPYLRKLDDGTIGMTADSCRIKPDMLDLYEVWARQNKPDQNLPVDPRLLAWKMWPQVPVELRPFFHIDDLFQTPTVRHNARNAYEKAMIHAAVQWNNEWMIESLKQAGL